MTFLQPEETVQYDNLIDEIETYFKIRRNNLVNRAKFNRRTQGKNEDGKIVPQEPIDTFINSLYLLADDCDYGVLKDEFIRDRIIVGVRDPDLCDHLCSQNGPMLTQAIRISRQWEARKEAQEQLRESKTGSEPKAGGESVDFVKK